MQQQQLAQLAQLQLLAAVAAGPGLVLPPSPRPLGMKDTPPEEVRFWGVFGGLSMCSEGAGRLGMAKSFKTSLAGENPQTYPKPSTKKLSFPSKELSCWHQRPLQNVTNQLGSPDRYSETCFGHHTDLAFVLVRWKGWQSRWVFLISLPASPLGCFWVAVV